MIFDTKRHPRTESFLEQAARELSQADEVLQARLNLARQTLAEQRQTVS